MSPTEFQRLLANIRNNDPALTNLSLYQSTITDQNAIDLAEALKVNRTITSVCLSKNALGTEAAQALAEALKTNETITDFDISQNEIGDEGAKALAEVLMRNKTITNFNISKNKIGNEGIKALAEVIAINNTITSLNLSKNIIRTEGAQALAKALARNQAITILDISENEIENESAKILATALVGNKTITDLNISKNRIGNDGASALATVMAENNAITSLNLSTNIIEAEGAQALAKALKTNESITTFSLAKNKIRDRGAESFIEVLRTNQVITSLDLLENETTDDIEEGFMEALKSNRSVTRLALSCSGNASRTSLLERNKRVEDALLDYAKTILSAILFRSTGVDPETELASFDDAILNQKLLAITRKILFSGITNEQIDEFSENWHIAPCQTASQKSKDYGGISWSSLFGKTSDGTEIKEIKIPAEALTEQDNLAAMTSLFPKKPKKRSLWARLFGRKDLKVTASETLPKEVGEDGWKIVARTNPSELKTEGRLLGHCVGGYSGKCINDNSHIISIVNPADEPVSTIEITCDYFDNTFRVIQHHGKSNSIPTLEARKIEAWFLQEISRRKIVIDYKSLERDKSARISQNKTLKARATMHIGFDPFDNDKFKEASESFKYIATKFLKINFAKLLDIEQIDLGAIKIGGKSIFNIPKKKGSPPLAAVMEGGNQPQESRPKRRNSLNEIQESFDIILGEGRVEISIVFDGKAQYGEVFIAPLEERDAQSIRFELKIPLDGAEITDLEDLEAYSKIKKGNKRGLIIKKIEPLKVKEILSKFIEARQLKRPSRNPHPTFVGHDIKKHDIKETII